MTPDTLISNLLAAGWREYPSGRDRARLFEGPRLAGPACHCNDRPPPVHLYLYAPFTLPGGAEYPGGVEVHVTGQRADGRWLDGNLYGLHYEETLERLPDLVETAGRVWRGFCGEAG